MNIFEIIQIATAIILSLGGSGLILIGLTSWLAKVWANRIMQDEKLKHDRELASLREEFRGKIEKGIYIYKIQYEKEFEIYQELWATLIPLYQKTTLLRPVVGSHNPQEKEDERMRRRLEEFGKSFIPLQELVQKYRPFYAPEVFNALNKIMQICYKESVEYEFKEGRSHKEYWDSQQKFSTDISEAIDECCETIRKRINTKVVE
jgi:hypothetical protein